jgi:hypothetical protein
MSGKLITLISNIFNEPQKCYGHCSNQARLKLRESGERVQGFYVCPAGYVSKLIWYAEELDTADFTRYLSEVLAGKVQLRSTDVRLATRYSWDLGLAGKSGKVMRVAFWTQNYRGSKTDDPDRPSLFLCSRCGEPFVQPFSESNSLCEECKRD